MLQKHRHRSEVGGQRIAGGWCMYRSGVIMDFTSMNISIAKRHCYIELWQTAFCGSRGSSREFLCWYSHDTLCFVERCGSVVCLSRTVRERYV